MEIKQIKKVPDDWSVPPNLKNYQQTYSEFCWNQILQELDGLPNGAGINIAYEAIDRHAADRSEISWPCAGSAKTGKSLILLTEI